MVCESPPSWSNHSDACRSSGYYNDCVSPFPYTNSTCYNWTNASECGGSYHADSSSCYQNVAHTNVSNNQNWSNNPACDTDTSWCQFGNSCNWGGDWCQFGNSCKWGGDWCQFGNSCSHYNVAGWPNNWACGLYCVCNSTYTDSNTSHGCWSQCVRGNCQVEYYNNSIPGHNDACYTGYPNSCFNSWGNSCYTGYPNSCLNSWGDACYTGYPDSCYYYANHSNSPPFNNFCNHEDVYS